MRCPICENTGIRAIGGNFPHTLEYVCDGCGCRWSYRVRSQPAPDFGLRLPAGFEGSLRDESGAVLWSSSGLDAGQAIEDAERILRGAAG